MVKWPTGRPEVFWLSLFSCFCFTKYIEKNTSAEWVVRCCLRSTRLAKFGGDQAKPVAAASIKAVVRYLWWVGTG